MAIGADRRKEEQMLIARDVDDCRPTIIHCPARVSSLFILPYPR